MPGKNAKRSDRLLKVLDRYRETVVVMHNNPDPDAMAAGWALRLLVQRRLKKPVRLLGRGPILRAENLQFVQLLKPPIDLVDELVSDEGMATVLVDCSASSVNHLLGGQAPPVAVIDHHEAKSNKVRTIYRDVRSNVTASASIAVEYMREQGMKPSAQLATALVYAIRTEMIGANKELSRLDHSALQWLSGRAAYDLLSEIENPPLPRYYYEELLLGLDSVLVYADSAVCFLPRITAAEVVGEMADLLVRCDALQCVLCGARVGDDLLLSARSKGNDRMALELLDRALGGLGHFGGHYHRAGGKVNVSATGRDLDDLQRDIRKRWLNACGNTTLRGRRLVRRKEITKRR
ncbi:MAG: DHH family phosphoesterase [Phycisphaerae bacterium]|nr:MAG: DHH family phosphoesterase [Phycisphaerae bacterium]